MRVCVGIHAHAEPARFRATLECVRLHAPSAQVAVIPDHPDPATAAAIGAAAGVRRLPAPSAAGGAGSLNVLLGGTDADVCVLLESGCLPGPGWLDHLLAGLAADPRNGLAGPSTNRSWNEQAQAPGCPGTPAAVASAAARLAARAGEAVGLEPLYSLADFCYAVRREVWEAVGAADEGFGAGPCWEMEYSARAARAGWRGVWVPAAFVWRAPFTARRARDERRLMEASRRRYQDRLCALRLRGERTEYAPHCRGDACGHFAPPALVQLRIAPAPVSLVSEDAAPTAEAIPPAPVTPVPVDVDPAAEAIPPAPVPRVVADVAPASDAIPPASVTDAADARKPAVLHLSSSANPVEEGRAEGRIALPVPIHRAAGGAVEAPPAIAVTGDGGEGPLVTCVMPTRGRPELALRAIRYFQAQDWPRRELVIVDDEGGALGGRLPADGRIRYATMPAGTSIGAKRNRAVEMARGAIVAHWDDDDWYAPGRLAAQAEPIAAGRADVTGLRGEVFFDLDRWEFWTCTPALHRRLFVHDVHGGTLAFRRSVWGGRTVYPAASLAEDAAFLRLAVRAGARLLRVDTPGLFVYLRHGGNAWRFACGQHVDPRGWSRVPEPPHLAADRAFYRALSAAAGDDASAAGPLVSCVMPTAGRRRFVPRAIAHFLRQDYAARELVILDDGDDAVEDLVPADPRIRYVRAPRARSLGAKRNHACSLARGALVAHWDDDDWHGDTRLSEQVAALRASDAEVCGLSAVRYFDPVRGRAWEYRWPAGARPWVGGNTLLYRRAAWERRPFPELNVGEDTRWVWAQHAILGLRHGDWFASLVHPGNTSRKQTADSRWHPVPLDVIREPMGADWAFYAAMAAPREPAGV